MLSVLINNTSLLADQRILADLKATLQDAMDAVPAGGGIVQLSAKTYSGLRDLTLKDKTTVAGVGKYSTILEADGGFDVFDVDGRDGIEFRDLTMDLNTTNSFAYGFIGDNCQRISMVNVRCINSQAANVDLEDTQALQKWRGWLEGWIQRCICDGVQMSMGPGSSQTVTRDSFIVDCVIRNGIQFGVFLASPFNGTTIERCAVARTHVFAPRSAGLLVGDDSDPSDGDIQTFRQCTFSENVVHIRSQDAEYNVTISTAAGTAITLSDNGGWTPVVEDFIVQGGVSYRVTAVVSSTEVTVAAAGLTAAAATAYRARADNNVKGVFVKCATVTEDIDVLDTKVFVEDDDINRSAFGIVCQTNETSGAAHATVKRLHCRGGSFVGCRNGAVRLDLRGEDIVIENITAIAKGRSIRINATGDIKRLHIKGFTGVGETSGTNGIEINAGAHNITGLRLVDVVSTEHDVGVTLNADSGGSISGVAHNCDFSGNTTAGVEHTGDGTVSVKYVTSILGTTSGVAGGDKLNEVIL